MLCIFGQVSKPLCATLIAIKASKWYSYGDPMMLYLYRKVLATTTIVIYLFILIAIRKAKIP